MTTLAYPNNITNGTIADADEVMGNFNEAKNVLNGNVDMNNITASIAPTWTGTHTFSNSIVSPIVTPDFIYNIGVSYSGGTFKLVQAGGNDLSSSNPGYISMPSTTAGRYSVLAVTSSSHLFVDDAGSSDIVGEEFGVTTGVAWAQDRPFFLYAVNSDDTAGNLAFAISPNPAATTSPATANCGYHGNPASTPSDNNFFFLSASDLTSSHAEKPCRCIGAIRMRMSASDDWTVQTLSNADGIGKFHEQTFFIFPTGQMGATSGRYGQPNSGTVPVFTSNSSLYRINRDGKVIFMFAHRGDGGTDGSGSVEARMATPYTSSSSGSAGGFYSGAVRLIYGGDSNLGQAFMGQSVNYFDVFKNESTTFADKIEWAEFSNGDKEISGKLEYYAF